MSRRANFINYILTILLTVALVFLTVIICSNRYQVLLKDVILFFIIGFIISSFVCAFLHELGHVILGKINKFNIVSMQFWFCKFYKKNGKLKFCFCRLDDSVGKTIMVAENYDNLEKRFLNMTFGGILFSLLLALVGLIPIIIVSTPLWLYGVLSIFLPVGGYYFFGNALPTTDDGIKNDGAMIVGLKKNDFASRVIISLLIIQSELYKGKSPSEIDEKYYFDLPQLPEDDLNFVALLNARYSYYLDKRDYENAKKVTSRLLSLEEYIPKSMMNVIKVDALFDYCTFNRNEEKADDLTYELEKFLNNVNTPANLRAKWAYILNILGEKANAEQFYKKAMKEAKKSQFLGLVKFETKLLDELKDSITE